MSRTNFNKFKFIILSGIMRYDEAIKSFEELTNDNELDNYPSPLINEFSSLEFKAWFIGVISATISYGRLNFCYNKMSW
jgi:hypothetical protein